MDCKKCRNFIELKNSDNNDTLYVCLTTMIFRDKEELGWIYLLEPRIYNETVSDCINFKDKTK